MLNRSIFMVTVSILALATTFVGCTKNGDDNILPRKKTINEHNFLFQKGMGGYACFRIPAIVKSREGTLLAFAEARNNGCSDEGDIDMVVRRSTDNGETWGDMIVIWSDDDNTCGNPAPVVDQSTGTVHLLMSWNFKTDDIGMINRGTGTDTRRVFVTSSTDDGLTWEKPDEITSDVKLDTWGWYATGPGHGIQITKGEFAGRLVIPCDNIELKSVGGKGYSHIIYSDDNGRTWQLGGVTPKISVNPNECTVAELSDGRLMLNMRVSQNSNYRMISTSNDGGVSWTVPTTDYELRDAVCQASLLATEVAGNHTLFFSNAASTARENMTIKMSVDDGENWSGSLQINKGPSAYSDIVSISNEELAILYEAGASRPYDGIVFEKIPVSKF